MYNIKQNRNRKAVADMVVKVEVAEFKPRSGVKIDTTDAEANARSNETGTLGEQIKSVLHHLSPRALSEQASTESAEWPPSG